MKTTLNDLINLGIFEKYEILSAKNSLNKEIHSLSILETPDFENYIIENSVILTTFYPIKSDLEVFTKLLHTLAKRHTAGILIKLKRYIDVIPDELIALANELDIPIITLNFDANLSYLFNSILSEMQTKDYTESSFDQDYSMLLKQVYDRPTTETLMQIVEKIPDMELLIHNLENQKTYYSNKELQTYFNQHKQSTNIFQKLDEKLYYTEDVIYDSHPIYRIVLMTKEEKRHILHNFIEIFKLLVIIVYQKKIEKNLMQHQFLINFISNPYTEYTNEQLIAMSRRYSWNINFPVILVIMTVKENKKNVLNPVMIEYIRTLMLDILKLQSDEIRLTVFNDQLLVILNAQNLSNPDALMKELHQNIQLKYKSYHCKVTYSNLIHESNEMSKTYTLLSDALIQIENKSLSVNVFSEDSMRLLSLLKNIDYNALREYIHTTLKNILEYEKKYNTPLIETLYTYIENQFNAAITAKKLFIHYNSVKYRLELLKNLDISINSTDTGYFELYFALFLYVNFEQKSN